MNRVAHELFETRLGKNSFEVDSIYKRVKFEYDFKTRIINESRCDNNP